MRYSSPLWRHNQCKKKKLKHLKSSKSYPDTYVQINIFINKILLLYMENTSICKRRKWKITTKKIMPINIYKLFWHYFIFSLYKMMSHFRNKTSVMFFNQKVVPNCTDKLNSVTVSAFYFFNTTIIHGIFRYIHVHVTD